MTLLAVSANKKAKHKEEHKRKIERIDRERERDKEGKQTCLEGGHLKGIELEQPWKDIKKDIIESKEERDERVSD